MAAKKRRKRLRWYAGGGVLLILLLVLGDPFGAFRSGDDGPRSANEQAGRGTVAGPIPDPQREAAGRVPDPRQPDADLAVHGGTSPVPRPGAQPGAGEVNSPTRSNAARLDEVTGLIARYERALSGEDLGGLAILEDSLRARPIEAPPALATRWREVQARAAEALRCGPRIRAMVRRGEILELEALLVGLRAPSVPAWLGARVDATAKEFDWPAIRRDWEVLEPGSQQGDAALAKTRRVRFSRDGQLEEGTLWRSREADVTVRMSGAGGFTFPVIARSDVEPVDAQPAEAVAQGLAAARAGRGLRLVLWSCHLREHGKTELAARLMAWVR